MRRFSRQAAVAPALVLMLAGCGGEADTSPAVAGTNVAGTGQQPVAGRPDGARVTLRGTVVSTTADTFILDYRNGRVLVEMDDWDWYREGRALRAGQEVVVNGRVDRELAERGAIEASSVYVADLAAYFFANDADEESLATTVVLKPSEGATDASGTVTGVEGREFTIGTGTGSLRVDTAEMANNPMAGDEARRVRSGDRVYVWGRLDIDPGEADELMAEGVVRLLRDSGESGKAGKE